MEARWIADRALLRSLAREHPTWSHRDLAEAVGRSLSWVKKWLKRFGEATPDDQEVLFSRSRAHHAPYPRPHPKLVERIVEMHEHPLKICGVCQGLACCSTTCLVIQNCKNNRSLCLAQRTPSGKFCERRVAFSVPLVHNVGHGLQQGRRRRFNWILRT